MLELNFLRLVIGALFLCFVRQVVHGEILGESLLLEDVLLAGKPSVAIKQEDDPHAGNEQTTNEGYTSLLIISSF